MKRGQVSLFVIIAIIIVGGIVAFFVLRSTQQVIGPSPSESEVGAFFSSCIEQGLRDGVALLQEKGGYIYSPEFEPGTDFSPTGSQLGFFGVGIPYWYYLSGAGVVKEQIPTKSSMEDQLGRYLREELRCDISSFATRDIVVDVEEINYQISIQDNEVEALGQGALTVYKEDQREIIDRHRASIPTKLGTFYEEAKRIYDHEFETAFLETYAVDVLRLYAPVDGVEIGCGPEIWTFSEVVTDLQNGLSENIQTIRLQGDYYELSSERREYFVEELEVNEDVRFLYSQNWPSKVEVYPDNNGIMIAEPVGNQPGLGILGFCYVPYHFVYDVTFPVLVQIYDEQEFFQFPVVVVVDKNKPRSGLVSQVVDISTPEVCNDPAGEIFVYVTDRQGNPVDARVDYNCGGNLCSVGNTRTTQTDESFIQAAIPQCINGQLRVEAEGYKDYKRTMSTVDTEVVDVVLEKIYEIPLEVLVDGIKTDSTTIITFDGEGYSTTVAYPTFTNVKLPEGQYNISVQVFNEQEFNLGSIQETRCVDVPKEGIFGFFGATEEQCFEINIPSEQITNLLSAGGKTEDYFLEDQLRLSTKIVLSVPKFPTPNTIEDLVDNFGFFEFSGVDIQFE